MKRNGLFAIVLSLLFVVSSCGVSRYADTESLQDIDELALITPLSYVDEINRKGASYSEELSATSNEVLTQALMESSFPIKRVIPLDYNGEGRVYEPYIAELRDLNAKDAGEMAVSYNLDKLLEANNARYGLMVFEDGYVRDSRYYWLKVLGWAAFDIAIVVATLGMVQVYTTPDPLYATNIWVAVFDSEEDRYVYYVRVGETDLSPLKKKHVTSLLRQAAKPFSATK